MASVTQTVSNYLGGVSKQTDDKKMPGQVRECLNALPDPTFGLMKRPGLKFEKQLSTTNLDDAKWFYIHRDGDEKYIGRISAGTTGDIAIWNAATGVACTINYDALPWLASTEYKVGDQVLKGGKVYQCDTEGTSAGSGGPTGTGTNITDGTARWDYVSGQVAQDYLTTDRDNYDILTVQDTSYITNKASIITAQTAPTHTPNKVGTVTLHTVKYSTKYEVIINGNPTANYVTRNSEDSSVAWNSSDQILSAKDILTQLKTNIEALTLGGDITVHQLESTLELTYKERSVTLVDNGTTGTGGTQTITDIATTVSPAGGTGMKVDVTLEDGVATSIKIRDNGTGYSDADVITIALADVSTTADVTGTLGASVGCAFTLTVNDDQGNNHLSSFQEQVTNISRLPFQSVEGRLVKVVNTTAAESSYWSKFTAEDGTSGDGNWGESRAPDVSPGLTASTMPHELLNTTDNVFLFRQVNWRGRLVGDIETNSDPSFVGKNIEQAFFHNNRLGFLTADKVSMSQSGDINNFFFTTALTTTDSDPIDISCASTRPAKLHGVIPTAQGLILFSQNQQFIMFSDSEILTPASAVIRGISNYEMDTKIDPVDVGTDINFVSKTPSYTRVFGVQTRGSQDSPLIHDVGKVVSEWIPDTVTALIASPQNSLIALYGVNSNLMYLYKTYAVGGKNLMQSWFKWQLPGDIQFTVIDSDNMYSVVKNGNTYDLLKASMTQTSEEEILVTRAGQQINPHMDYYASASSVKYKEVTSLTLGGNLTGYTGTPTVTISAPIKMGFRATAEVIVDSNNTITGLTITDPGGGYEAPPTVTIIADTGGSGATATAEINTDKFTRCYLPYADIENLTPVVVVAGTAQISEVTESGYTLSPDRGEDANGTKFFKFYDNGLMSWVHNAQINMHGNTTQPGSVVVGYKYNFDVELPKTYFKSDKEGSRSDYTANLTIARMKFSVGLSSDVGFKLKSKGYIGPLVEFIGDGTLNQEFIIPFELREDDGIVIKVNGFKWEKDWYRIEKNFDSNNVPIAGQCKLIFLDNAGAVEALREGNIAQVTNDTWYDLQPVQQAGEYLVQDVPLTEDNIFTLPIHQRTDNFNLRIFSNSPFPVSLNSMSWEGNYSPRFYRRT